MPTRHAAVMAPGCSGTGKFVRNLCRRRAENRYPAFAIMLYTRPARVSQPSCRPAMAKILLIDDDSGIRDVVRFALAREGFAVIEAEDGAQGLALAERETPDLIVLDIMMPELDGTEVCRRLRRTSRVPIIFLTSRDEEIDRVLGLELGGDDYVSKPFSPRELVARVKAVLRRMNAEKPRAENVELRHGKLRLDLE